MSLEDDDLDADVPQPAPTNAAESKVGTIEGSGHTVIQATHAYIYNLTGSQLQDGNLEGGFKGRFGLPSEENEDQCDLDETSDQASDMPTSSEDKIIEEIAASSNDAIFVNPSSAKARAGSGALPRTSKEIEIWYYQVLNDAERCFVNACAVLHGATLRVIAEATRELYTAQKEQSATQKEEGQEPASSIKDASLSSVPPSSQTLEALPWFYWLVQQDERARNTQTKARTEERERPLAEPEERPLHSLDILLERSYTYPSYTNGATRIFWRGTDMSGLSSFSIDLLRFLAREAAMEDMFGEQTGPRFLDIVKQWPAKYRGERSWRSANALGVIWWHQDARNLLWRQADRWARSQQKQDWEHAAALLDGAYQVESGTIKAGSEEPTNSLVIQLLEKWITTAHKWVATANQTTVKRGEGYAAARAYALIGRKSPEVALKGLERLLRFPPQTQNSIKNGRDPVEDLFIFGILKYVDIARSGHIRQVLKHLADGATQHIHQQGSSRIRRERNESEDQRSAALHVVLTAFFLLASCSLSAVDTNVAATYSSSERLQEYPICPDNKGRDLLLAGVLTTAEPLWQNQLATLLASIIMEKNYPAAFYLMTRWGEIVLKDQSRDASVLEDAYVQFLVKVGQLLQEWSIKRGSTRLVAIGAYKRKLTLWLTDRRLPHSRFKDLAQRVLEELSGCR